MRPPPPRETPIEGFAPTLLRTALITAAVTAGAQLVGCPIDVVSRLGPMSARARMGATMSLVCTSGPFALFRGLHMHILKRAPTKALTVCFFEALHRRASRGVSGSASRCARTRNALFAGMLGLGITYPLSVLYYGARKGYALSAIAARVQATAGGVLYAGLAPALLAVGPSVAVDYCVYQNARSAMCARNEVSKSSCTHGNGNASTLALAPVAGLVLAAAGSKVLGGLVAEPMKTVARRSAQAALKGKSTPGGPLALVVARELASKGFGEFWRGFPRRAVRYSLTAVVSKTAMQGARGRSRNANANVQ